jgi:hypothetical protein
LAYYVQIPYFSLGFPIQGRADFEGVSENENIYKSVIPLSFTWGLGAGVEYELKSAKVTGGLTFQNSILDVIEDKGVLNTGEKEDAKQTLNRVTLRLGIFF